MHSVNLKARQENKNLDVMKIIVSKERVKHKSNKTRLDSLIDEIKENLKIQKK